MVDKLLDFRYLGEHPSNLVVPFPWWQSVGPAADQNLDIASFLLCLPGVLEEKVDISLLTHGSLVEAIERSFHLSDHRLDLRCDDVFMVLNQSVKDLSPVGEWSVHPIIDFEGIVDIDSMGRSES